LNRIFVLIGPKPFNQGNDLITFHCGASSREAPICVTIQEFVLIRASALG
jgi:hypothetical protein